MNQLNILKAIIQHFKIKIADLNNIPDDVLQQVANKLAVKLPKTTFKKKVSFLVKAFNEFAKKRSKFQKNLAPETTEDIFNKAYNTKSYSSAGGGETGKHEVTKYIQPPMGLPPTPQEFLVSNLTQTIKEASDKTVTASNKAVEAIKEADKKTSSRLDATVDYWNERGEEIFSTAQLNRFMKLSGKLNKDPDFNAIVEPELKLWIRFRKGEIKEATFARNVEKIELDRFEQAETEAEPQDVEQDEEQDEDDVEDVDEANNGTNPTNQFPLLIIVKIIGSLI